MEDQLERHRESLKPNKVTRCRIIDRLRIDALNTDGLSKPNDEDGPGPRKSRHHHARRGVRPRPLVSWHIDRGRHMPAGCLPASCTSLSHGHCSERRAASRGYKFKALRRRRTQFSKGMRAGGRPVGLVRAALSYTDFEPGVLLLLGG